ncbi:DUF4912 domain-containing protein [Sporosarcina globispora]|uniref:DUF4912 domain-containing protein n=1 Tax=Sporosarcina globispora TaxID=1459 RepID=UPI000AF4CA8B|nr:DUF4912 domain-containing protein [Sporosarcina globispora]
MIDEIIKLRRRGLSFRRIASELDTTVGKVQYQWTKLIQNKAKRDSEDLSANKMQVKENAVKQTKDQLIITRLSADKIKVAWKLSIHKEKMASIYFDEPASSWRKALRIYDVTGVIFDGANAECDHEVILSDQSEWIFKGLKLGNVYCIELGIKMAEIRFFPLLRSEAVHTSEEVLYHLARMAEEESQPAKWTEKVSTYTYYEPMDEGEGKV